MTTAKDRITVADLIACERQTKKEFADFLHDCAGQKLTVVTFAFAMLDGVRGRNKETVKKGATFTRQAMEEQGFLRFILAPSTLEGSGFQRAVEELMAQVREYYGIEASYADDGVERAVGPDLGYCMFQAAAQIVCRAAVAGGATRISARIEGEGDMVRLVVSHNGKPDEAPKARVKSSDSRYCPVSSAEERLYMVGGTLKADVLLDGKDKDGMLVETAVTFPLRLREHK